LSHEDAVIRPWWRKGSIVAMMTAIIAAVVPITTAVQQHYEKERELAAAQAQKERAGDPDRGCFHGVSVIVESRRDRTRQHVGLAIKILASPLRRNLAALEFRVTGCPATCPKLGRGAFMVSPSLSLVAHTAAELVHEGTPAALRN